LTANSEMRTTIFRMLRKNDETVTMLTKCLEITPYAVVEAERDRAFHLLMGMNMVHAATLLNVGGIEYGSRVFNQMLEVIDETDDS